MKRSLWEIHLRTILPLCALLPGCGVLGNPPPDSSVVQAKFSSLYGDYLSGCKGCHAPGAPGYVDEIEKTLNFTSATTAYQTIKNGRASGLKGNQEGCNGAPFIQSTAAKSLIYAVLDGPTRQAFDLPTVPNCDANAISDMTVKVGSKPSTRFMSAFKDWIEAGAPNN